MNNRYATFLGFFAAVSVAPVHYALCALPQETGVANFTDGIIFFGIAYLTFVSFSLIAALLVGLPSYLLLTKFEIANWWSASLTGCIAGVIVAVVGVGSNPFFIQALNYALLGAISGLTFWVVRTAAMTESA